MPASARELGDGVGAAGDVEIEDLAVLLPQSQTLTEEEGVEQAALGGRDMRRNVSKSIWEPLAGSDQIVVWLTPWKKTPKCTWASGRWTVCR